MYRCPRCGESLKPTGNPRTVLRFGCGAGCGQMVTAPVARKHLPDALFHRIWQDARGGAPTGGLPCMGCRRPMVVAPVHAPERAFELDLCVRCHVFWFDRGELDQELPEPPAVLESTSTAQRDAALAAVRGEMLPEPAARLHDPLEPLRELADSVARGELPRRWLPWATYGAMAALVLGLVLGHVFPELTRSMALSAEEPTRGLGLPLLLSPLFQRGWLSPLVQLLFLFVFGANLEAHFGSARVVMLMVVSSLLGSVAHVIVGEGALVGLSPVVTAVAVAYTMSFGRLHLDAYFFDAHLPASALFAVFVLLEVAPWVWLQGSAFSAAPLPPLAAGALVGALAHWAFSGARAGTES